MIGLKVRRVGKIMKRGHRSIIIGQVMQDSQKKGMVSAFLLYF
jgi:hypothetical protein